MKKRKRERQRRQNSNWSFGGKKFRKRNKKKSNFLYGNYTSEKKSRCYTEVIYVKKKKGWREKIEKGKERKKNSVFIICLPLAAD